MNLNTVQIKTGERIVVGILVSLIEVSENQKGEMDKLTIIVENVPVLITEQASKISKLQQI